MPHFLQKQNLIITFFFPFKLKTKTRSSRTGLIKFSSFSSCFPFSLSNHAAIWRKQSLISVMSFYKFPYNYKPLVRYLAYLLGNIQTSYPMHCDQGLSNGYCRLVWTMQQNLLQVPCLCLRDVSQQYQFAFSGFIANL